MIVLLITRICLCSVPQLRWAHLEVTLVEKVRQLIALCLFFFLITCSVLPDWPLDDLALLLVIYRFFSAILGHGCSWPWRSRALPLMALPLCLFSLIFSHALPGLEFLKFTHLCIGVGIGVEPDI